MKPVLVISPSFADDMEAMRLIDWLMNIDSPQLRATLVTLYRHYEDILPTVMGSSSNHQAWPGGLRDHLADMCRLGWSHYQLDTELFGPLPFTFDDVVVGIFCHDAEKFVRYGPKDDPRCAPWHDIHAKGVDWEEIKFLIVAKWEMNSGYTFKLTDSQYNAIKYTHGEGNDHRKNMRVMGELAAFVGNLDRASARIWHSRGQGLG